MFTLILAAAMFLPRTVYKFFPPPQGCVSSWGAVANYIQNVCRFPIEVDVALKDGHGRHIVLDSMESSPDIGSPAYKAFACEKGKGVASASNKEMVHPGYKATSYVCMESHLDFGRPNPSELGLTH